MKIYSILFALFISISCFSQNYYEKPKKLKVDTLNLQDYPNKIILCDTLKETSALQYVNGFLYTVNDGGGKAEVYKIEPKTGKIIQTIILNKAKNVDWEALAYDGKHLFIGDFGNNLGDRSNLAFYKFKLSKINPEKKVDDITPDYYLFSLDDQTELVTSENNTTNFDIESFVFDNEQLHIFTKEWKSGNTKHETLETFFKFQLSKIVEEFEVGAQITDASLKNDVLFLTAYTKQGFVYLYKFTDFKEGNYFNGKMQKIFLGLMPSIGQIEGVTIAEDGIYLSGEAIAISGFSHKQVLYFIPKSIVPF